MKYPNPTFLKKASKVKHTRRNRTIVVIVCLCLVTAIILFILKMASMQDKYRKDYPQLVGAATATTAEPTPTPTPSPTPTPTIPPEQTTTELQPSFATEATTEETIGETEETEQDNSVEFFEELEEGFHFHNEHPLQTVSHDLRDQSLDDLKQDLEEYISQYCNDAKVSFYYINLGCNETMGVNELTPIVPAGAFNIGYAIDYYNLCQTGVVYPYQEVIYSEGADGNSSYIASNYSYGKHFHLRTLAYYAFAYNDNVALKMLLKRMGNYDSILDRIGEISCYVDFSQSVLYYDRNGNAVKGPGRSSCYDLGNYLEYLYNGYKNSPEIYQPLLDDLSRSAIPSGYTTAFSDPDDLVIHMAGRNEDFNSYTDIAIIDSVEPFAVSINVECDSYDRSVQITADLATLLSRYIKGLHE